LYKPFQARRNRESAKDFKGATTRNGHFLLRFDRLDLHKKLDHTLFHHQNEAKQ